MFRHADGPLGSGLEPSAAAGNGHADLNLEPASEQAPLRLLTLGASLSMLVAAGGLLQALASGLGPHPATRLAIGLSLLALSSAALLFRKRVLGVLRYSPRAILLVAAAQTALVSLDGLPGSPYFASCLIPIGVAMIAGPSLSWLCAGVVDGVLILAMAGAGPSPSFDGGAGTAIGALLAPPASTLVLATLARAYERTVEWVAEQMAKSAVPPREDPVRGLLPPAAFEDDPAAPWAELTPAEMRAASDLARWGMNARIGHERGVSESTIRNQVGAAMKKTGCRTRLQLAALTAHPAWPRSPDGD
jgi:DNA-binding CsgD family transcriptional regulator